MDADAVEVMNMLAATPEEERQFIDSSADENQATRRHEIVQIVRAYRDARFRPAVMRAYNRRCAICQYAMKLVDAAHIIPVSDPHSTDEITNGIALCGVHHTAYDTGLLGIQSNYRIIVNPQQEHRLAELRLGNGLPDFKGRLPQAITLPSVIETRPDPAKLILGLRARRWPERLIA